MKNLRIGLVAIGIASGCDGASEQSISIDMFDLPNGTTDRERGNYSRGLDHVVAACPGLTKYADDIRPVAAVKQRMLWSSDSDDADLSDGHGLMTTTFGIVVAEAPRSIPRDYFAQGQHCFFSVRGESSQLNVAKRPCASICLDRHVGSSDILIDY